MKVCPTCRAVYQDPGLNFCLEDGSPLQSQTPGAGTPPPTMPGGQVTFGAPPQGAAPQAGGPGAFGGQQGFTMQPPAKKASKWWIWAIVGVIVAVVGCSASFVILGLIGMSMDNSNNSNVANSAQQKKDNRVYDTLDFSGYVFDDSPYFEIDKNGESMTAKTKSGVKSFILTFPAGQYEVHGGGATVTVTNVSGKSSLSGYGIAFHAGDEPRERDYFFVIDSVRGEFRISQDKSKVEKDIVEWTPSDAIKRGGEANVLEVEDKDGKIKFFINGTNVGETSDKIGTSGGSIGVYFSDAKVEFSSMKSWR